MTTVAAPTCLEPGCDRPVWSRGRCNRDDRRLRNQGALSARTPADRLWERVAKTPGCWTWTGTKERNGYGRIRVGGQAVYVHRLSFELANGPIAEGLHVDHLCRNRLCVNPAHLEQVTQAENNRRAAVIPRQRAAACGKGHALQGDNVTTDGRCRECGRERARQYQRRRAVLARAA